MQLFLNPIYFESVHMPLYERFIVVVGFLLRGNKNEQIVFVLVSMYVIE